MCFSREVADRDDDGVCLLDEHFDRFWTSCLDSFILLFRTEQTVAFVVYWVLYGTKLLLLMIIVLSFFAPRKLNSVVTRQRCQSCFWRQKIQLQSQFWMMRKGSMLMRNIAQEFFQINH